MVVDQQLYFEKEGRFPSRSDVSSRKADGKTYWHLQKRCSGNKCFEKVYGKGGLKQIDDAGGIRYNCIRKD